MGLDIGQPAPDFSLRDEHGQSVSLSSYVGEKVVVIVFYPFAFSNVCRGELAGLRDRLPSFVSTDAQLLAVSCDPTYSLRALADRDGLGFPLLSDFWPHGAVASAYGVFDNERGCAGRASFIINKEGIVRWTVHNAWADARDLEEHVAVLRELVS